MLFRIRIEKFWNNAVLYFCSVVKFHPYSSVFLSTQETHFLFQMGWTLHFICYPTLWALQNGTSPRRLHCLTLLKQAPGGGKRWGGIYYSFLSVATTLFCHVEHRRGQRHNSEPPLLSPPFPVSSLKSCSCVPWSKEAVILGRLHVSYSGQGEVITSSSHTAQSC